jgi:hypothetical protein
MVRGYVLVADYRYGTAPSRSFGYSLQLQPEQYHCRTGLLHQLHLFQRHRLQRHRCLEWSSWNEQWRIHVSKRSRNLLPVRNLSELGRGNGPIGNTVPVRILPGGHFLERQLLRGAACGTDLLRDMLATGKWNI